MERSGDWWAQAERDLRAARTLAERQLYEWACFAAQQAAEKAVKAAIQARGGELRGHAVRRGLQALEAPVALVEAGVRLDRLYIPTRYPDVLDQGSPGEVYLAADADTALKDAEAVLEWCRDQLS
jgi:HEPN domain-containing protein